MPRLTRIPSRAAFLSGIAATAAFAYLLSLSWAMQHVSQDVWGGLIVLPILLAITMPVLTLYARKDGDGMVLLLQIALLTKVVGGTLLRYAVIYNVYGGLADAQGYHGAGRVIAASLRAGVFPADLGDGGAGTRTLNAFTGVIYYFTGPTKLGAFFIYSWLAFVGLFLCYCAFRIACPDGDHRRYAKLIFFLPTLLFWPSSVGKEAWLVFALGISAYGAARIIERRRGGFIILALGLWSTSLVRTHIAVFLFAGIAAAYLMRDVRRRGNRLEPTKVLGIVVMLGLGFIMASSLQSQFKLDQLDGGAVDQVLDKTLTQTTRGDSEYSAVNAIKNPELFPLAVVTVLFRPFPFEAGNLQAIGTSLEGAFLLGLAVWSYRRVGAAFRRIVSSPFVAFAVMYTFLFILAFSSIGNFGILARQRAQVLPFLAVVLSLPSAARRRPGKSGTKAVGGPSTPGTFSEPSVDRTRAGGPVVAGDAIDR